MKFSISRYDPERDAKPYLQDFELELLPTEHMLLDVILRLKQQDPTLTLRKSCREGVCGSDAMNINGRNGLACITRVRDLKEPVVIRPLPSFPIVRDLVVDMTQFYKQYHSIRPYLVNDEPPPEKERLQTPDERDRLNGSYECILWRAAAAVPVVLVEPRIWRATSASFARAAAASARRTGGTPTSSSARPA